MLYQRDITESIKKVLFRDEFIILTGARQTGKTSLLIMLKAIAEERNYQCHYFNLENPIHLEAFNNHPYNLFDFIPDAFVVSKNAYEVKFIKGAVKKKTDFGHFMGAYPDIKFRLLTYEEILPFFYGWKF